MSLKEIQDGSDQLQGRGKHVTCEVIFATVRAQPYWKLYPYAVSFLCFFLHNTKIVNANKFCELAHRSCNLDITRCLFTFLIGHRVLNYMKVIVSAVKTVFVCD